MTIINLPEGTHTIKWTLSGYNDLTAQIRISSTGLVTCISVSSGSCGGYSVPRVSISGSTVTGYMKSGVSTPTPTITPSPTPGKEYINKLSRDYAAKTLPFELLRDDNEGEYYIYAPDGSSYASGAYVDYNINIPKSDTYKIIARVLAADYSSNSFYFQVDSKSRETWDMKLSGNVTWRNVSARGSGSELNPQYPMFTTHLTQGTHKIRVMHRENNTRLYKFVVTNDLTYVPGAPTPTPAPTITPTPFPSPTPTPSYQSWLTSKGGYSGLFQNLSALLEIIDGYLKFTDLGFTVTLANLLRTVDAYLGF